MNLNQLGLWAIVFVSGLFVGWKANSNDKTLYEFHAGPSKTSPATSGFACYCSTAAGGPRWKGKIVSPSACPQSGDNSPSTPKKLRSNLNITSGACCKDQPKINGKNVLLTNRCPTPPITR
jgi:hypothetical protein